MAWKERRRRGEGEEKERVLLVSVLVQHTPHPMQLLLGWYLNKTDNRWKSGRPDAPPQYLVYLTKVITDDVYH